MRLSEGEPLEKLNSGLTSSHTRRLPSAYNVVIIPQVAIKILEKSKIVDAGDRKRVNREINILKNSYHPHIIYIYEVTTLTLDWSLILQIRSLKLNSSSTLSWNISVEASYRTI